MEKIFCGGLAKVLDYYIIVNKFKPYLQYYIHFQMNTQGKDTNPLIRPDMGSTVYLLFFYKDNFSIK